MPSWIEYRLRLSFGMIFQGYKRNMQPLNFIKDYYGEKMGFYFAWLIHYTGWLILPSLFGVIISIVMIVSAINNEKEWTEYLNSPYSTIYGIIMMVWVEIFNESWKRKENAIANMWLVRDFKDSTTELDSFIADTVIDPETKHRQKVSKRDSFWR